MSNMEQIIKNIDELLEQLKKCAYGWTMPSGNETGCMPSHFASYATKMFAEIDKINEVSPDFWGENEYYTVYDCERLSRHELAWATDKACKNSEDIVLKYLAKITEIVEMIHRNAKK